MELKHKWRTLLLLSLAELLGMAVWFSASAVVPSLTTEWNLSEGGQAWLTMSVQIGFVVGALGSAILNISDRTPARWLFAGSALGAGVATALIPLAAGGLGLALPLRFLTGMLLAGVYPVGMKIMATWTKEDRGLGIGLLVAAVVLGSAMPHFLRVFGNIGDWKPVLYASAGLAMIGGVIAAFFIDEGPYRSEAPPFDWKKVGLILRERDVVLANLGYLGHMWELYAAWTWVPVFILASFTLSGVSPIWAGLLSALFIGIGGIGSVVAGKLADSYGRTTVTTGSMIISGGCCLLIGFFYGGNPILITALILIWGFTIVADSAQFSAAVSELSDPAYVGTALTMQTSLGFLLTIVTIRLIPTVEAAVGWKWAFPILIIGPIVGIWAMQRLRQLPSASKLADGKG